MSIYEIMVKSFEVSTPDMYLDLLDADYVFVRHQSGEEMSKEEWAHPVIGMFNTMREGKLTFSDYRCLYENNEILIMHHMGTFPDGTKEAILVAHVLKDGKIIRTESGATPIK